MGRMTWLQLRSGAVRSAALLLGMLLATTAFTVLAAASRTAQLRTVGTVSEHFIPAYEVLVRPQGTRTRLETQTGTVQPNFLSGIYGGITMTQDRQIASIPGVEVAAPIAMIGYTLVRDFIPVFLPAVDNARPGRALYRYSTTWVSDGGLSRISQPPSYLYLTPDRLRISNIGDVYELRPRGSPLAVCPQQGFSTNPFGPAAQSSAWCWSKVNGTAGAFVGDEPPRRAFATVDWSFPMLLAAIDPVAEAKLDGLDHALISGNYLGSSTFAGQSSSGQATFPVLAAASSGVGEFAQTQIERLAPPPAALTLSQAKMISEATAPGTTVRTTRVDAQQAYAEALHGMEGAGALQPIDAIWTAGPITYRSSRTGSRSPLRVTNPSSVWEPAEPTDSLLAPPMDNAEPEYRKLQVYHLPASPEARLVGVFDPAKVRAFDPLSRVPLGPYQPDTLSPANAASRAALHGASLLPNLNLGGYVSQPADLITTLAALPTLQAAGYNNLSADDPISVIRVRVAGVTGPDALSLERIREVAQQIVQRTHLEVDIVAGSSPAPTNIELPAGPSGLPPLTLTENWVKKGVAVSLLTEVDQNSAVLFALILIVCILFVANSATAAVRSRRRELGVLTCLGWTKPRLFAAVLGELAALGLTAGLLGAAAALPLSSLLGLHASPGRALLAVPVAIGVAIIAGLVPAWLAARAEPTASIRPPVLLVRHARQPGGITALAIANVLRTPGRALIGAVSLAVGVTGLTMLAAVTFAFRGVIVGSLLGDAVAVQVRGVDYVAALATIALGVLAVADVVFLNVLERATEFATIRAFGWRESALSRLIVTEGAVIGLAGALAGAIIGLAATVKFTGQLPGALYLIAGAAVIAGALVTAISALLPAQALRRLSAASLLAEE
jgi:putative ABC transport system permease protein